MAPYVSYSKALMNLWHSQLTSRIVFKAENSPVEEDSHESTEDGSHLIDPVAPWEVAVDDCGCERASGVQRSCVNVRLLMYGVICEYSLSPPV